jgi:hypothetical protein
MTESGKLMRRRLAVLIGGALILRRSVLTLPGSGLP